MGTQTRQENIFAWSEFNFIKNATLFRPKWNKLITKNAFSNIEDGEFCKYFGWFF